MIIKGLKYSRYANMPREWKVVGKDDVTNDGYVYFGNLNLLVGKNASGKSRTLVAIRELANLISNRQLVADSTYHTQSFDVLFDEKGKEFRYILDFREKEIVSESLFVEGKEVLSREKGFITELNEKKNLPKNFEKNKLVINLKRNNGEFYFPSIVFWGYSLKNFLFSDQIEKDKCIEDISAIKIEDQDVEDLGVLIPLFHWGREEFGQKFEDEILESMNELGYKLTDIDIRQTKRGYSINVEEEGKYMVSQKEMSQGMYRALALLVILINSRWRHISVCILVDDMAEGLDHERSKTFIDIIIKKTFDTEIQYFMTTNDRYVMNQIHLKYWTVIERRESKSIFYNIFNSAQVFEDFKYTSLNNFDFFTTDFYKQGFGADENDED